MALITAEIIKEIRLSYGESQELFSKRLGVTESTIRNWESIRSKPIGENLETLRILFATYQKGEVSEWKETQLTELLKKHIALLPFAMKLEVKEFVKKMVNANLDSHS